MIARSVGLGPMFGWIPATFRLVSRNFGAMVVASLLSLLLVALLALPMLLAVFNSLSGLGSPGVPVAPPDLTLFWVMYGVTVVLGLLAGPPLLAGWFRLCEAADRGVQPSGSTVLSAYRDVGAWVRLVLFALLGALLYLAFFGLMFLLFRGVFTEIATMQATQLAGGTPPPPSPAMLGKILLMYVVMMPVLFVLQFVYMVGIAEVSLRPTGPVQAFLGAMQAVLRNAFKLLLLMICLGMVAGFVGAIVVFVLALLAAVLALLSPVLMGLAIGLVYIALLLVVYPLMFAGNYYAWKDLLGEGTAESASPGSVAA
jgi:hypothetical protein